MTLWGTYLVLKHFNSQPPHLDAPFALYPVSILKPLKGVDADLAHNLETFFHLDYPEYELLFSVADAEDPACAVVRTLLDRYPCVNARLVLGQVEVGVNPKVNNLVQTYDQARYDWILISDSNVRVRSAYLKRLVGHLDSTVGIVTAIVAGRGSRGLGGQMEAMFLNTFYSRAMLVTAAVGRPCVIGKSMLFRRSVAARFGGIRALGRYLAEDFMAGEAMRRLGLRVVVMADPIHQHIGQYAVKDFWNRHVRWGRIRKAQNPLAFGPEIAMGCFFTGLLGALGWSSVFAGTALHLSAPTFFGIHCAVWSACDLWIYSRLEPRVRPSSLIAWVFKECAALPLWLHILAGNTVHWRGRQLRLLPGGMLAPAPALASAAAITAVRPTERPTVTDTRRA